MDAITMAKNYLDALTAGERNDLVREAEGERIAHSAVEALYRTGNRVQPNETEE
jgi:cation transport regulator ChaB